MQIAGGRGYINVQQTFKINADFIVSMGVFTDKDENGELVITDALFGLEMVGEVIYNVDVQIGIEVRYVTKIYDTEKCDGCRRHCCSWRPVICFKVTLPLLHFRSRCIYCFPRRPYRWLAIVDKIVNMKINVKMFSLCFPFVFPL